MVITCLSCNTIKRVNTLQNTPHIRNQNMSKHIGLCRKIRMKKKRKEERKKKQKGDEDQKNPEEWSSCNRNDSELGKQDQSRGCWSSLEVVWWIISVVQHYFAHPLPSRSELKRLKSSETLCAIWYHFYNLKTREKHLWRSVTLSKVESSVCIFTKSNTAPWLFSILFKLYQKVPNRAKHHIFFILTLHCAPKVPSQNQRYPDVVWKQKFKLTFILIKFIGIIGTVRDKISIVSNWIDNLYRYLKQSD